MKKLFLLLMLSAFIQINAQGLLNNLKGCYPLHCDGAVNNATTGVNLNGTLFNVSCTTGHLGLSNTSYQFAGNPNSYIDIANANSILGPVMSISAWVYVNSNSSQEIIHMESGCSNHTEAFGVNTEWNGSQLRFRARKRGNLCTPSDFVTVYSAPITANAWYHVVLYFDNSVATLWVNGVSTSVNHSLQAFYMSIAPLRFGLGNMVVGSFTGKMEDIRIYDRALTAGEITQLSDPSQDVACTTAGSSGSGGSGSGSCCLGNLCGSTQNPLLGNYEIPMNSFNFNFTTSTNSTSKLNLGSNACNTSGPARLNVMDDNIGTAIYGNVRTNGSTNIAVRGYAVDVNSNAAVTTFGILGESMASGGNVLAATAGVAGFCGGYNTSNMPVGEQIGVYGNSISNAGHWAGYFDGDVNVVGKVWGSQFNWSSDKRFKKEVKQLEDVSEKLSMINGYSYLFKTEEFKNKNFPDGEQLGLIAQELKLVFPQLVTEDRQGYLAVNYIGLVPLLLEGFKEQRLEIRDQKQTVEIQQKQIEELKAMVISLMNNNQTNRGGAASSSIELNDNNAIVLNQNVPNPFSESTTINYNIPIEFKKAQIIFVTNTGKILKAVDIVTKGNGNITVYANDLSNGSYSYSLVVDGRTIETKLMIKE